MVTMERWPNFFIVGAPKAGTTSLYEYLNNVSGIYMSPVKEPHFFDAKSIPEEWIDMTPIRDKQKYLKLFSNAKDEKIIGEASPSYLADPEAVNLIHQVSPNAHILISLRDPIERAFSHYLMYVRDSNWSHSFHEQIEKELRNDLDPKGQNIRLRLGMYHDDVKKFFDVFGSHQIKVVIFEEWIKDSQNSIQDIIQFLGIDQKLEKFVEEKHNLYFADKNLLARKIRTSKILSKITKNIMSEDVRKKIRNKYFVIDGNKPKIDVGDRKFLIKYYQNDVRKLEKLLGKKLPWKNFLLCD